MLRSHFLKEVRNIKSRIYNRKIMWKSRRSFRQTHLWELEAFKIKHGIFKTRTQINGYNSSKSNDKTIIGGLEKAEQEKNESIVERKVKSE